MISLPGAGGSAPGSGGGDVIEVRGVIGSEKRAFFESDAVRSALEDRGYRVTVDTAGSRRIATDTDLADYDFAFPSSAPAGEKIASENENLGVSAPFHSPMAIATFEPILQILADEGVARQEGGHWFLDMMAYTELAASGARWQDLGETYPSPRTVQISTTDIRTSNSAAMYLAILSWLTNGGAVVTDEAQVQAVVDQVTPMFTGQGYTESTSAGPFADYLSQGMGNKPMALVYEAQFLGELLSPDSRIRPEMVLAYPDPTVLSTHTMVALTPEGQELSRLLTEDRRLQQLAASHGFRPNSPELFTEALEVRGIAAPPDFLASVDPPAFDRLEQLIEGVGANYSSPAPPEGSQDE